MKVDISFSLASSISLRRVKSISQFGQKLLWNHHQSSYCRPQLMLCKHGGPGKQHATAHFCLGSLLPPSSDASTMTAKCDVTSAQMNIFIYYLKRPDLEKKLVHSIQNTEGYRRWIEIYIYTSVCQCYSQQTAREAEDTSCEPSCLLAPWDAF